MFVCVISAGGPSFFLVHLPLTPLPPWCDNYLVVMDKVEVLAVEVVRPGHRSRGDRSKDRVLVPPSISPLSSSPIFFNTKQQLKVTSNKATTFKLIYTTKSLYITIRPEHVYLQCIGSNACLEVAMYSSSPDTSNF